MTTIHFASSTTHAKSNQRSFRSNVHTHTHTHTHTEPTALPLKRSSTTVVSWFHYRKQVPVRYTPDLMIDVDVRAHPTSTRGRRHRAHTHTPSAACAMRMLMRALVAFPFALRTTGSIAICNLRPFVSRVFGARIGHVSGYRNDAIRSATMNLEIRRSSHAPHILPSGQMI